MTTTPKFEDFEKFSKQQMELMNTFSSTFTKGMQEIAAEAAEYSKKAFAANSALVEQLLAAKSPETAVQIQTEYAKSAYESFVSQTTKMNELYVKLASEAFKPVETLFSALQPK